MTLNHLLQGDVAKYTYRAVMRDLTARQQAGIAPPEFAEDILAGLREASQRHWTASTRTGPATVSDEASRWVSAMEGADAVDRSVRWVQQLIADGRVRSRQIDGRTRQVDLDSLRGVIAEGRNRP